MKCVICRTGELGRTAVEEEVRVGNDVLVTPIETLVCDACGERYYDRPTMKYLERVVEEAAVLSRRAGVCSGGLRADGGISDWVAITESGIRGKREESRNRGMQLTLVRFVCALDGRPEGAERE